MSSVVKYNLLLDHVGLPQVVIVAVHLVMFVLDGLRDHPETFLQKALCCQAAPSWLKVVGWVVVACEILLSSPGTGVLALYFRSKVFMTLLASIQADFQWNL